VVAAYGQILPKTVLSLPRLGCINLHASLLPRYRGAAPVAWAILRGESETGLTTFLMDEGMDTGPILRQARVAIGSAETAGDLTARLAVEGSHLLLETLEEWKVGRLTPIPQEGALATLAPRLRKEDGCVRWERSAVELVNLVRAMNPWPGAVSLWEGGRLTFWRARAVEGAGHGHAVGTLFSVEGSLAIAAGDGGFLPLEVQPEGRPRMSWEEFVRGHRVRAGARFEEIGATAPR
jgi:methionyl-tRNA formyltransferase